MKILFIGDIVGKIGRRTVARVLPKLIRENKIDFVIANGENSAHGSGMTESTVKELLDAGVDYLTSGDHAYKRPKQIDIFHKYPVLAPANFSACPVSPGFAVFEKKGKGKVLLINLIGRVFMKLPHECPFKKLDEILANNFLPNEKFSAIIVDMHAEATSEKVCLAKYADGRVSAVLGTHTHIMTADHKITDKQTAYITDTGMVGSNEGSLGIKADGLIKTFLTNIKEKHEIPKKGQAIFNSVLIKVDPKSGKAKNIKPIVKFIEIKNVN